MKFDNVSKKVKTITLKTLTATETLERERRTKREKRRTLISMVKRLELSLCLFPEYINA